MIFKDINDENTNMIDCLQETLKMWYGTMKDIAFELITEEWTDMVIHYADFLKVDNGSYAISTFDLAKIDDETREAFLLDTIDVFHLNKNSLDSDDWFWGDFFYNTLETMKIDDVGVTRNALDGTWKGYFYFSGIPNVNDYMMAKCNNNAMT